MTDALRILRRFEELGTKHAFRLRDGRDMLGWIVEVGDEVMRFLPAPTPFDPEDIELQIPLDRVDLSSLAYWDDARCAWIDLVGSSPHRT